MKIRRYHALGCGVAIIGILIVGFANVKFANHSGGGDNDAVIIIIYTETSYYWIYIDYSFAIYQWIFLCFLRKIILKIPFRTFSSCWI